MDVALLRAEFVRLLTEDGSTNDRRRRGFNQAIFATEAEGGHAMFTGTDLAMVLDKFDAAVKRTPAVLTPDETAAYVDAHPEVLARARQIAADHGDGAA
jgi:hypothetical protein